MAVEQYTKICSKCGLAKRGNEFARKQKKRIDGTKHYWIGAQCKKCVVKRQMEWALRTNQKEKRKSYFGVYNKTEIANKRKAAWKLSHKEQNAAINRAWRQKNPEKQRQYAKAFAKRYPHKVNAWNRQKEADKLRARPKWANLKKILEIYKEAEILTKTTGVQHCVDHIIPLKGKTVCGLHVENNLRVMTFSDNCKKYNFLLEEFA